MGEIIIMRAILLLPEKNRFGLSGKPLLNTQGIVGSLKGSFVAGHRTTLINLKGISEKLAEAQRVMTSTVTEIDKAGETIDDIKDTATNLSNFLDYWDKWDRKGVHDKNNQLEFLATAMQQDTERTMMLGETVDPYPYNYNNNYKLPRGFEWDSYFEWSKHDLVTDKDKKWLESFGEKGTYIYSGLTIKDMLTLCITTTVQILSLAIASAAAMTAIKVLITSFATANVGVFPIAPTTKAAALVFTVPIGTQLAAVGATVTAKLTKHAITVALESSINLLLIAMESDLLNYNLIELIGKRSATDKYKNSFARTLSLFEQYYTFFYFDPTITGILNGLAAVPIAALGVQLGALATMATACGITTGFVSSLSATTDIIIPPSPVPFPNVVAVVMYSTVITAWGAVFNPALTALLGATTTYDFSWPLVFLSYISMMSGIVTRKMFKAPNLNQLNISSGGSPKMTNSENSVGSMKDLECEGFTKGIGQFASLLSGLAGKITDLSGKLNGESGKHASKALTGSVTKYDSYFFIKNKRYFDDRGITVGKRVAPQMNIKGNRVFYGDMTTILEAEKNTDIVCWSHVYNENIFNFKSTQFGNREIEKTIVLKTRAENDEYLYRAYTCLCTFKGSNTLYLLWERDHIRYKKGKGAEILTCEQIIDNFDFNEKGDLFSKRSGKIRELWATTFDGHRISYRPNIKWQDNYLLDEFINREVVSYDKWCKDIESTGHGDDGGNIYSYENPY